MDSAVRVSWVAPNSNYKTITAYEIGIADHAGANYHEETTTCDGADAAVLASLYCDIPVSVLRVAPYELILQDLVVARVRAYNERGWGSWSVDNAAGALIETEPSQMASPTRGSATGTDRLELEWTLLVSPDDGYSAVTTYALYWDAGTVGSTWTSLVGEDSEYTLSSYLVTEAVDVGVSYLFKVRA